jgi:transposase
VRQDLRRGAACSCAKTAASCRELLEGEQHLETFLRVAGVDPTNNAAERALRHAVIWRKTSGGTEGGSGSPFVERMLSVVATCRQQGRHALEYLTACHEAHLLGHPAPSFADFRGHSTGLFRTPWSSVDRAFFLGSDSFRGPR